MKNTEFRFEQLLKSIDKLIAAQQEIVNKAHCEYLAEKYELNYSYRPMSFSEAKKLFQICFQKKNDLDLQKKELEKLQLKKQFYEKRLSLLTNSK